MRGDQGESVSKAKNGAMAEQLHKFDTGRDPAFSGQRLSAFRSGLDAGGIDIGSETGDLMGPLFQVGDVDSVAVHGKECEGTRGGDQAASDWPALISRAAGATRPPKTMPIAPAVLLCSLAGTATARAIVPTEATRERVARARVRDIRGKG